MESILDKVKAPVIAHEILGDAVSLYAIDTNDAKQADEIHEQTQSYFKAFREKEASLISDCQVCSCEACDNIGKLKLKAILHAGQVAFSEIKGRKKISGEDVILAHRLLKNSIRSNEYVLMTSAFAEKCRSKGPASNGFEQNTEQCDGIGPVEVWVKKFEEQKMVAAEISRPQKIIRYLPFVFFTLYGLTLRRIFKPKKPEYRNLPI